MTAYVWTWAICAFLVGFAASWGLLGSLGKLWRAVGGLGRLLGRRGR